MLATVSAERASRLTESAISVEREAIIGPSIGQVGLRSGWPFVRVSGSDTVPGESISLRR